LWTFHSQHDIYTSIGFSRGINDVRAGEAIVFVRETRAASSALLDKNLSARQTQLLDAGGRERNPTFVESFSETCFCGNAKSHKIESLGH
jgi:hypothetical protein